MFNMETIRLIIAFFASAFVVSVAAEDIASAVHKGPSSGDYFTFETGLSLAYVDNPHVSTQSVYDDWILELDITGEWQKGSFFVELSHGTQDGANVGFNIWHNDRWAVDFLAISAKGLLPEVSEDDDTSSAELAANEGLRNRRLEKRNTLYSGTGFRVTRHIDKYVLQYRLVTDTYDGNGLISTLRAGRGWQVRNWNFSGIISAQYTSARTNNYWFGVSAREATSLYPQFEARDSINYSVVLSATKPLAEHWLVRGLVGYHHIGRELEKSPLLDDSATSVVSLSVNYVFF